MDHAPARRAIDRRQVLKAAAWSAPVVALTVATPLAAASDEPPSATFAQQLWDIVAPSGVQTQFGLYGRAVQGGQMVDATLPAGTSVTFAPPLAGTVSVTTAFGTVVENLDGSVTVVFGTGHTEVLAYVTFQGYGTASADGFVPGLTPETFSVYQTVV